MKSVEEKYHSSWTQGRLKHRYAPHVLLHLKNSMFRTNKNTSSFSKSCPERHKNWNPVQVTHCLKEKPLLSDSTWCRPLLNSSRPFAFRLWSPKNAIPAINRNEYSYSFQFYGLKATSSNEKAFFFHQHGERAITRSLMMHYWQFSMTFRTIVVYFATVEIWQLHCVIQSSFRNFLSCIILYDKLLHFHKSCIDIIYWVEICKLYFITLHHLKKNLLNSAALRITITKIYNLYSLSQRQSTGKITMYCVSCLSLSRALYFAAVFHSLMLSILIIFITKYQLRECHTPSVSLHLPFSEIKHSHFSHHNENEPLLISNQF